MDIFYATQHVILAFKHLQHTLICLLIGRNEHYTENAKKCIHMLTDYFHGSRLISQPSQISSDPLCNTKWDYTGQPHCKVNLSNTLHTS